MLTNFVYMKGRKLTELYGRRYTPWTNVIGVLLIVAFGIFLAVIENNKVEAIEKTPPEQLENTDRNVVSIDLYTKPLYLTGLKSELA